MVDFSPQIKPHRLLVVRAVGRRLELAERHKFAIQANLGKERKAGCAPHRIHDGAVSNHAIERQRRLGQRELANPDAHKNVAPCGWIDAEEQTRGVAGRSGRGAYLWGGWYLSRW